LTHKQLYKFMEEKNIKQVKYSDKEAEYRGNLYKKLLSAKNQRDAKHIEFDDADYLTFYESNAKAANSYIRPKNEEEDTRIVSGTTQEKEGSLLSSLLSYNFGLDITAYDKSNLEEYELGENMQDLVKKSRDIENYEEKRRLIYKEALDQGTCFVEENWHEELQVKKNLKKINWAKGVDIKDINWGEEVKKVSEECRSHLLCGKHVYLGNVKEFFINEQPYLFTIDKIPYSRAEAMFHNWERWKYVPRKLVESNPDNKEYGFNDWTILAQEEDVVEIVRYQNKFSNEFMILCNGVMMLPTGFPLPWGVYYNLVKLDIEPISKFFAYSKSIPAKTKVDQAVLDEMLRLMVMEMRKNFAPPLANNSGMELSKKLYLPGQVTRGLDVDLIKPIGENNGITNSMVAGYELVKKVVDSKTVSATFSGESAQKRTTATEIMQQQRQTQMKLGNVLLGVINFEAQLGRLRINNIINNWTTAKTKATKQGIIDTYRTIEIVDGGMKKVIEFSERQPTPEQLLAEQDIMSVGRKVKKVIINPKELKKTIDYTWQVTAVPTQKENDELEKVLFTQSLTSGFQLFGPQRFNQGYVERRWADVIKEDYSKMFNQQQPMMPSMAPQGASQQSKSQGGQQGGRVAEQATRGLTAPIKEQRPSLNKMV